VIVVVAASIARALHDIVDGALGRLPYGPGLARTVQVVVAAFGVIAALNQVGVATTVTEPVLVTVLATTGGILVVGLGGGLVQPMRYRWERLLDRAEADRTRHRTAGPTAPTPARTPPAPAQPAHQPQPAYQAWLTTPAQNLQRPVRTAGSAPASSPPAPTPIRPPGATAPTAAPARVRTPGSVL
jgi:hypothetical protein